MPELEPVTYQAGGQALTGYLADGSAGRRVPGLLLAHEGAGLTAHTKERALRLAALGYVAFALDMYGEEDPPLERAKELGLALRNDVPTLRARLDSAFEVLRASPHADQGRLAAIGFCMGGAAAIELARSGAPLKAIVGFHSGFLPGTPAENRAIAARLLLCHGAADPVVTRDKLDAFLAEMDEAGVDWQLHLYGGVGHSFTNPHIDAWNLPGFAYDETADRRSWQAMLNFLDEVIGPPR